AEVRWRRCRGQPCPGASGGSAGSASPWHCKLTTRVRVRLRRRMEKRPEDAFIDELMDTSLYSMGAYFSDEHPELVDEVIAQSEAIESTGLRRYSEQNGIPIEDCFNALLTGLVVRHYQAVRG